MIMQNLKKLQNYFELHLVTILNSKSIHTIFHQAISTLEFLLGANSIFDIFNYFWFFLNRRRNLSLAGMAVDQIATWRILIVSLILLLYLTLSIPKDGSIGNTTKCIWLDHLCEWVRACYLFIRDSSVVVFMVFIFEWYLVKVFEVILLFHIHHSQLGA